MRLDKGLGSLMLIAFLAVTLRSARAEDPAESATDSGEITVTGCVEKGVEAGCWVLTDENGKVYSFTNGSPALDRCYRVTASPAMGFCMQGTQLDVETIEATETDCCDAE